MNYFDQNNNPTGGSSDLYGSGLTNPAGLAYRVDVSYDYTYIDKCESAWAEGCGFKGANWAMYFTYCVQGWQLKETMIVPMPLDVDGTTATMSWRAVTSINSSRAGTYRLPERDSGRGISHRSNMSMRPGSYNRHPIRIKGDWNDYPDYGTVNVWT